MPERVYKERREEDGRLIEWLREDVEKIRDDVEAVLRGIGEIPLLRQAFEAHVRGHEVRGRRWWTLIFQITGQIVVAGGAVVGGIFAAVALGI